VCAVVILLVRLSHVKAAERYLTFVRDAEISIYEKLVRTRQLAVYLETHCNIGSKRAFTTGVLES